MFCPRDVALVLRPVVYGEMLGNHPFPIKLFRRPQIEQHSTRVIQARQNTFAPDSAAFNGSPDGVMPWLQLRDFIG